MIPIELLIPSLLLNLIYILLKLLDHKQKFKHIIDKLINNKEQLEKSIRTYKESIYETEYKEELDDDIIKFIETITDLTQIISFKTV
jgi:hypothetical protein